MTSYSTQQDMFSSRNAEWVEMPLKERSEESIKDVRRVFELSGGGAEKREDRFRKHYLHNGKCSLHGRRIIYVTGRRLEWLELTSFTPPNWIYKQKWFPKAPRIAPTQLAMVVVLLKILSKCRRILGWKYNGRASWELLSRWSVWLECWSRKEERWGLG